MRYAGCFSESLPGAANDVHYFFFAAFFTAFEADFLVPCFFGGAALVTVLGAAFLLAGFFTVFTAPPEDLKSRT